MALLVRIVEFIIIIVVIRTFLKMVLPVNHSTKAPPPRSPKVERFNDKECDISDADYEDIT